MGFQFDATINFGHLVTIVSFLLGGIGFIMTIKGEIKMIAREMMLQNEKIDNQGSEIKKLGEILVNQAVANERMNFLDKQIKELQDRIKSNGNSH